ncbi:hypothetical protein LWE69_09410 [Paenibacillus sp. UKAQ_18]|nr:hypothetical protein [Paenibacillus sp. UKAQ_18]
MKRIKLQVWVNEEDKDLFYHLEGVKGGERAYESRRLMRLGLQYEKSKGISMDPKGFVKAE